MSTQKRKTIRLGAKVSDLGGIHLAYDALNRLPCVTLKELLRERRIPIPKYKITMLDRLTYWLRDNGQKFTIKLG